MVWGHRGDMPVVLAALCYGWVSEGRENERNLFVFPAFAPYRSRHGVEIELSLFDTCDSHLLSHAAKWVRGDVPKEVKR